VNTESVNTKKETAARRSAGRCERDLRVLARRRNAVVVVVTSLEDVLAHLDASYLDVTGAIPNRFDFTEGETGYYISDGDNDMYDSGNFLSTSVGGYIDYTNG